MKVTATALCAMALVAAAAPLQAQEAGPQRAGRTGVVQGPGYHTEFVRVGGQGQGLLFEPNMLGPKAHIALVYSHPENNNLNSATGPELASRGYRTMNLDFRGTSEFGVDAQLPNISAAVAFMRTLPGVTKVVVVGHSGGTHQMALYDNVAEHGPSVCNGPEKLAPCLTKGLDSLQKPDGVIFLDPPTGAMHEMTALDPAVDKDVHVRNPAVDMYSAANGYDAATHSAHYSADFAKRFYAAQSARNNLVIDQALARLQVVKAGKSQYADDEPIMVPGLGWGPEGARLYTSDLAYAAHTKVPHLLLKSDGSRAMEIIRSVRPPASGGGGGLDHVNLSNESATLREYLSRAAIRTTKDFAITADDIVGVDWKSAIDNGPGNADGVTVPSLVMVMGCHYLIVPGEVLYDRLAAKDKTMVGVEGALHGFAPCKPQYGDTQKRTFDYIDEWLSKDGRF